MILLQIRVCIRSHKY
uniref:Uncharacterized protein n=1 Tax=Anguilla anguilla TaxID=7936 RepID=A0A0E9UVY9_ANGAN